MMDIYALWHEVFPLEHLKNFQYLKYWMPSEVVKVKNDNMFNFKNCIPEDQAIKIKNILTTITETCNIKDLHVI